MKQTEYEPAIKSKKDGEETVYRFESADGVHSKKGFRESELLLADVVEPLKTDDVLVVQAGFGFLGVAMADRTKFGMTTIAETSDRAYQLIERNIEKNGVEAEPVKIPFYSELDETYDQILYAPRGYEPVDVVKGRLASLVDLLGEDGELFISGSKKDGMNRYEDFLGSMEGEVEKMMQDGATRLYRFTGEKGDVDVPDSSTGFTAEVDGSELEFEARKGLFSPEGVDDGSRLLIENLEIDADDEVIDLACGYGTIGSFVISLYGADVSFSDDSATATYCAEENLERNGLDGEVANRDCLDAFEDDSFDVVVSNPPTHQGRSVTSEMFSGASEVLRQGGVFYLVYNSDLGFEKDLQEHFRKVEVMVRKYGFSVTKAVR